MSDVIGNKKPVVSTLGVSENVGGFAPSQFLALAYKYPIYDRKRHKFETLIRKGTRHKLHKFRRNSGSEIPVRVYKV